MADLSQKKKDITDTYSLLMEKLSASEKELPPKENFFSSLYDLILEKRSVIKKNILKAEQTAFLKKVNKVNPEDYIQLINLYELRLKELQKKLDS